MRYFLTLLLAVSFLTTVASADRSRLNGTWNSSSGALIVVGPTDSNGEFVMNVYVNGNELTSQVTGGWFDGPNFVYKINGEQIVGTYMVESDTVELTNRSGSWTSTWHRD